ncbi:MAG: hypothetical protein ACKVP3_11995 [Hyphomicrobiaceae bacterium]
MRGEFRWIRRSIAGSRFNFPKRAMEWKAQVDALLLEARAAQADLASRHADLASRHAELTERHAMLSTCFESVALNYAETSRGFTALSRAFLRRFPPQSRLIPIRKNSRVSLLPVKPELGVLLAGFAPSQVELVAWSNASDMRWDIAHRHGAFFEDDAQDDWPEAMADSVRLLIRTDGARADAPIWAHVIAAEATLPSTVFAPQEALPDVRRRRLMIALGARDTALVPHLHALEMEGEPPGQYPPFGEDPVARGLSNAAPIPAEPRKRSVLFVNPAYYNFFHLADSLRKRGWDAVSMAIVDPASDYAKHFHGFDWNLFEPDANQQLDRLRITFKEVASRFDMVHFHGRGTMSFFPYNYDVSQEYDRVPWDVLELKRRGARIAYTHVGTPDLHSQSSFETWSPSSCPKCVWRDQPVVCSNERANAWRWKVQQLADLICIETDPPLDFLDTPAVFREPLSFAVDPNLWHPDLTRGVPVPEEWREPKEPGEILIYHSVGNYELRTKNGVNVKGTGAVIGAIDRLNAEGHPVRLLFRKEVPSLHNRWILAQADIIVDQLNYGRYGATAREGLMLGRPVVGRLNKIEPRGISPTRCIAECPVVDASEETVYDVLKRLVENPEERARIGEESRAHALQWWSKDVLAERYERVYDHIRAHGRPPETLDN